MALPPRLRTAFLDTSFVLALASSTDRHHVDSAAISTRLETDATRIVTTDCVLFEIGNALAAPRTRSTGATLLRALLDDPAIECIVSTDELNRRALELYQQRSDKSWGLTDCLSFLVMADRGIDTALTADQHFLQAGFRALLLES